MTMGKTCCLVVGLLAVGGAFAVARDAPSAVAQNALSEQEQQDGWRLLWDGRTDQGWRSVSSEKFPERGWEIRDGELSVGSSGGGHIITKEKFSSFELKVYFKTSPGCNSGIKYLVRLNVDANTTSGQEALGSDDSKNWRPMADLPSTDKPSATIDAAAPANTTGRFVRVHFESSPPGLPIQLSEVECIGALRNQ